ncbi:hypothetical protein [Herbaspirillum sp. NPDC087042]|uniref:hypothetical protein n=1 Tax=Herbaspirillum sp. NPDC087042 TaxID=3364004 RepID=UPI00382254BE
MMTVVAFLMLTWLVYELAKYTASLIRYDEHWIERSFFRKLNATGFAFLANNFVCAGLNFFIPTVLVSVVWLIAPAYHLWTRREFKKAIALEKEIREFEKRRQIAELEERRENLVKLRDWFDSAPDWYYPQERDNFFRWLEADNELSNFHTIWDEYLRLHMLGLNSGRPCICHLDHLTYPEKQARGDLAWKRIVMNRDANSGIERKAKSFHVKMDSPEKQKRKSEKAVAAQKKAREDDERYLSELRNRGRQDKAAFKLGR